MFLLEVESRVVNKPQKEDEMYIDSCIISINLLDELMKRKTSDSSVRSAIITPMAIIETISKTGAELKNLSLEDKVQILKDNDGMILWINE